MKNFPMDITFVIFTFNEEKRIERAIKNFLGFGRILVVDNDSTDGSREIAKQYDCDILINRNAGWVEDEITAARVKDAVTTEWIYWGFADEMIDRQSLEAVFAVVNGKNHDIVNIVRKNYYYGSFCNKLAADRMNRIFRKNSIDFRGNTLHHFGHPVSGSRVHSLPQKYFVHHFISNTATSYLKVMDRYTDMENSSDVPMPSLLRLVVATFKAAVLNLVFRRGYKSAPAYLLGANVIYYRWLSAMKSYEKSLQLSRTAIEEKNDAFRDRILSSLR